MPYVNVSLPLLGHEMFVRVSIGIIFGDTADYKKPGELLLQKSAEVTLKDLFSG